MNKSFLLNSYRILVLIRSNIICPENTKYIDIILNSMKNNAGNNSFIAEMEKVRASHNFQINTETKINLESDFFIGNLDYDVEVEKSDEIEIILEYSLRRLKTLICNENYNEAYDLTDAIHALPEIYAEGRTDNLSNYWKIFIEPIREKWGYDYFNECEKLFV